MQIRIDTLGRDVGFYVKRDKDVDWVFVDNDCYPRPGGLYADNFGVYGDNQVCLQSEDGGDAIGQHTFSGAYSALLGLETHCF